MESSRRLTTSRLLSWSTSTCRWPLTPSTIGSSSSACSLILSRIDYCNAVLHGAPSYSIKKLQRVQNNAARMVLEAPRRSHVSPLPLHWLSVQQRIDYKVALLTFKVRSTSTPSYLRLLIQDREYGHNLRSTTAALRQPFTTTFAKRAFRCSAPAVWNSLPETVINSDSFAVFKFRLKIFLFSQAFSSFSAHWHAVCPQRLWSYDLTALYKSVYYYYYYNKWQIFCSHKLADIHLSPCEPKHENVLGGTLLVMVPRGSCLASRRERSGHSCKLCVPNRNANVPAKNIHQRPSQEHPCIQNGGKIVVLCAVQKFFERRRRLPSWDDVSSSSTSFYVLLNINHIPVTSPSIHDIYKYSAAGLNAAIQSKSNQHTLVV